MTDLVRVKRGRHPWVTEPESGGGGGSGVEPSYIFADTSSSPSVPNDGNPIVVTFDDGVVHQDGTDITLNADQQHFDIHTDGYYVATFVALFNASDPTGVRLLGITIPQDIGSALNQMPGDDSASGGPQATGTVTAGFRALAGDSIYAIASVKGAAGAVDLDYAEMAVTKIGEIEAGAAFQIGSSWLQVVGDTIDSVNMGSVAQTTWADFGSAGADLELRAGGRWIDVITEGWYATAIKANINGAANVVQMQRIVSSGGAGTMNTIDQFQSADPANLSTDLTMGIPAEHFIAGESLAIDMFADNAGSVGTYDANVGEALWMITRLA